MTAETIKLADRRGQTDVDDFQYQRADRKAFHDAFGIEMQAAFKLVRGRRICAMDRLDYQEFELWVADRIMKRSD
jgi:hypothetical protein